MSASSWHLRRRSFAGRGVALWVGVAILAGVRIHGPDHPRPWCLLAAGILLFAAGFETTTNLIGNGLAALLANPHQADLLRQQPALAAGAVEELLRYDAPVQTNGRTVLESTRIADVELEPGQVVLTLLGAANRDPDQFTHPDSLDITRTGSRPLSFGAGIHFCLGAPLARLELQIALGRFLERFGEYEVVAAEHVPNFQLRGLAALVVKPGLAL